MRSRNLGSGARSSIRRSIYDRVDGKVPDNLELTGAGGNALSVVLTWPERDQTEI